MPFVLLILSGVVTVALLIHCYKTGRDRWWMYALLVLGPLAAAAYTVLELGPDLLNSVTGRRVAAKIKQAINPHGEVNKLNENLERSGSVDSRRRLAEEMLSRNDFAAAEKLYRESRSGVFEHDPVIMLGQAEALFGLTRYKEVIPVLEDLMKENPEFRSQKGHLLYARAQAEAGNHELALSEFETLTQYFTGPEARVYYAQYLETQGDSVKAKKIYAQVLDDARLSPAHYRKAHKQWINIAKKNG